MCTRLVVNAGSPDKLLDWHIRDVPTKWRHLHGRDTMYTFGGFRRIETIDKIGRWKYTEQVQARMYVPIVKYKEGDRWFEEPGFVTFLLEHNQWRLVTAPADHGVKDRFGNCRKPWIRRAA